MSSRKPRSDSKLKTLPAEQQARLYALLQQKSYKAALSVVRKDFELDTSEAALSAFFAWYPLSRRLEQAKSFADQLKDTLSKNPALNLDAEKLSTVAQIAFEAQAVAEQDPKLYIGLRELRQKDAKLALDSRSLGLRVTQYEEKMKAIRSAVDKAKAKGGLTPETLKQIEEAAGIL